MQAAEILRLVSGALQDLEPGIRARWEWNGGDDNAIGLLDFLNHALSEVVMQRPDATAVTGDIVLEPGIRQAIPGRKHGVKVPAMLFIGLNANVCEGRTGRPIVATTTENITGWSSMGMSAPWAGIEYFAYDRMADPLFYWVFPAVPEECEVIVNATWSAGPPHIGSPDDCLCLRDTFAPAIVHHILYGILSGDNEASNLARAQHHLSEFYNALGVKRQVDAAWPRTSTGGAQ